MKNENFIIINGQKYDSVTGEPLLPTSQQKPSKLVDSISKKSHAIYRQAIKRPINATLSRKPGRNMDIARSKSISHFKSKASTVNNADVQKDTPTAPSKHPLVTMGERKQTLIRNHLVSQRRQLAPKTPQAIKEEAITKALEQPTIAPKEKNFFGRHAKLLIISLFIAVAGISVYLTYTTMPSFSVKIASAQAGINATFPGYYPDGYSPNGPVIYNNNQVVVKFKSNTDSSYFDVSQTRSTWDSTAVKSMVSKKSNNTFLTTAERGLTVYIYNGNAAWVNGGILYEITGNAPLSSYQVQKIATSL